MFYSLNEMRLQGTMVVVFIKTNMQSKMINTTTMIPCWRVSKREYGMAIMACNAMQYNTYIL